MANAALIKALSSPILSFKSILDDSNQRFLSKENHLKSYLGMLIFATDILSFSLFLKGVEE